MPCSRSARRPSESAARSATPSSSVTASRWSVGRLSVSCSSRPISVLLPSSTEPAVVMRRSWRVIRSLVPSRKRPLPFGRGPTSEVPLAFPVFHRGGGGSVVGTGFTALGHGGRGDLLDHPLDVGGPRADGTGDGQVAD